MTTQTEWVPGDTFAARLVLLRRELDLTTDEIADRCGIKRPTWQTWEHGTSPRNMSAVVAQIALATGVNRNWLTWGGPLSALNRPNGGPSGSPGQSSMSDNDTELMQYRSRSRRTQVRVKAA